VNYLGYGILCVFSAFVCGCMPELPVTSVITIDMESVTLPVNAGLYGLSLQESGLSGDEGLYAEFIPNKSFDRGDSLPGWRVLSPNTYLRIQATRPVSESNPLSLMVSVISAAPERRGGVIAGGQRGIPLQKGEKYHLSFFLRTPATVTPVPVRIALEDSATSKRLSAVFTVTPSPDWIRHRYTFTASEDASNACLTFSLDQNAYFWIDEVSLTPEKTWNNRPNGFRTDLMERIAALSPAFIHYQGNTDPASTAFADFLQMCKDLKTEAVYDSDSLSGHTAHSSTVWINGLSVVDARYQGTLRAAVAEACYLIRAESQPYGIGRIAFAPVARFSETEETGYPSLIRFDNSRTVASPSYYMLQMFVNNRGEVALKTDVNTYARPQVIAGGATVEAVGESFEITDFNIRKPATADSAYNYELSAQLTRVKERPQALFCVREHIYMRIGQGKSELWVRSGSVRDSLDVSRSFDFPEEEPCRIRMVCRYDSIRCYINDSLIHDVVLPPIPAIVANATLDRPTQTILLKVVNTTLHDEVTEINLRGASVSNQATLIRMEGLPEDKNTYASPLHVAPFEDTISFPMGRVLSCTFPPNSITILQLHWD